MRRYPSSATLGTVVLITALAAPATAADASPGTARGAAATHGRGAASFTFAPKNVNAAPSVAALSDGSDVVTWIDKSIDSVGTVKVCRIDRGKNGCAGGSLLDLGDGTAALPEPSTGNTPTVLAGPEGEVVILVGGAGTVAFVSHDDGHTFAAPLEISNTIVPDSAELTDNGSSVLIGGASYLSPIPPSTFQFVDVPLDGSGLDIPTVVEPASGSEHYTLGFWHSTPVIAATTYPSFYAKSGVTWAAQTGPNINDAASWTIGTLPEEGTPSLATTPAGLVLGALNTADPKGIGQSYPLAATFNGTSFSKPVVVSLSKQIDSTMLTAAAGSIQGHNRYTITWTQVGCTGRCKAYAVSSKNGRVWTKQTYIGYGLIYNANASMSPDGGGLLVGYDGGGYEADRLYVGTTISYTPSRVRVKPGTAVVFDGALLTDLGAPVPQGYVTGDFLVAAGKGKTEIGGYGSPTDKHGHFGNGVARDVDVTVTASYSGSTLFEPSNGSASYQVRDAS